MALLAVAGCGKPQEPVVSFASMDPRIPREAAKWRPVLLQEVRRGFGATQHPDTFFGQVHQESRWDAEARSKYAIGIAQFTPGTARDMQRSKALAELCKDPAGCPTDPRWGLRALVLLDKDLFGNLSEVPSNRERLAMMLVGYNGGARWVVRERRACAAGRDKLGHEVTPCDNRQWFGHVERTCLRAEWACTESRGYPRLILDKWAPVYHDWVSR